MEETGRRLTKYTCYIGCYDFRTIQGKWNGRWMRLTGFSNVTHVGPIIEVPNVGSIAITVCAGSWYNDRRLSVAKVHKEEVLEKMGAVLIEKIPVGQISLDLSEVINNASKYTDMSAWDLIFHHFVGRFLGLTRPRTCTSYVCGLFKLPEIWHPAKLYRLYR